MLVKSSHWCKIMIGIRETHYVTPKVYAGCVAAAGIMCCGMLTYKQPAVYAIVYSDFLSQ